MSGPFTFDPAAFNTKAAAEELRRILGASPGMVTEIPKKSFGGGRSLLDDSIWRRWSPEEIALIELVSKRLFDAEEAMQRLLKMKRSVIRNINPPIGGLGSVLGNLVYFIPEQYRDRLVDHLAERGQFVALPAVGGEVLMLDGTPMYWTDGALAICAVLREQDRGFAPNKIYAQEFVDKLLSNALADEINAIRTADREHREVKTHRWLTEKPPQWIAKPKDTLDALRYGTLLSIDKSPEKE
jgi:hypothetical protein